MPNRTEVDVNLDRLYRSSVRCPYCGTVIRKYTMTCERCGVSKKQISQASGKRAKQIRKEKTGEKICMVKTRPQDIKFTNMALLLILGWFGAHNFYAGRRVRGFIMLSFTLICIAFWFVPNVNTWRTYFTYGGYSYFPTDVLGAISMLIWFLDIIAVVFGYYKYPVRLGEVK